MEMTEGALQLLIKTGQAARAATVIKDIPGDGRTFTCGRTANSRKSP